MEPQELVNALKRRGHAIGKSAVSNDGLLLNVNGRMMNCADAEKLLYESDELLGIEILARQAEQLIEKFGIEITHAPVATYGSDRYKKAVHALDRLSRAEVQLTQSGRFAEWEQTTIDGRDGKEMVRRLLLIKAELQKLGEGAPQPKAVASI